MKLMYKGMLLAAAAITGSTYALAEPVEDLEAVITEQSDGQITARTRQGEITITLSPSTSIRETDGLRRTTRNADSLLPGLIIEVEGDRQGDVIAASRIQFSERAWRTAVATKAGTTEQFERNAAEVAELRQAIIEGQEYVIQQEATVYFASGSTTIAPAYQTALRQLAQQAGTFGNYRISILGFADQRGDTAANERLSMRRADAVSNFLRQSGQIEPGRVLAPSAMGEGTLAPGETAPTSDAEARRVIARVVTPKTQLR